MNFSIQDRMELKRKLHCKSFSWYLKNVYPELLIPTSEGGPGGSLKQGAACLDSMGHLLDGNVGLYPCHDTGGNQVRYKFQEYTMQTIQFKIDCFLWPIEKFASNFGKLIHVSVNHQ